MSRPPRRARTAAAAALLISLLAPRAQASWPADPTAGFPVCGVASVQTSPAIASDGAGGMLIAWLDTRGAGGDVFVQRVLSDGRLDPAWPADGAVACTQVSATMGLVGCSDGAGGMYLAWMDGRAGNYDVYAQHLRTDGTRDPGWPAGGLAVCTAALAQMNLAILADGAQGAWLGWEDLRAGSSQNDIYVHHLAGSGLLPAIPANGLAICTATSLQSRPVLCTDLAGGAYIAWYDYRASDIRVYAHHVLASGALDGYLWYANGSAVCAATGGQYDPIVVPDGSGGLYVAWRDWRAGTHSDIYATHLSHFGVVDSPWSSGTALAVCTAAGNQDQVCGLPDGQGGMFLAWRDARSGTADIYEHHVLPRAAVDATWPVNGRALCTASNTQQSPLMVGDGQWGSLVAWADMRTAGVNDLYAAHASSAGVLDTRWGANGVPVSTASGDQSGAVAIDDGTGGMMIAWPDGRSTPVTKVYAARLTRYGTIGAIEPSIDAVEDVRPDQGGWVRVSWEPSAGDRSPLSSISSYDVLRLVSTTAPTRAQRGVARPAQAETDAWEVVARVTARRFDRYAFTAATPRDSGAGGLNAISFKVLAHDSISGRTESSQVTSGHSADNLAPAPPGAFAGTLASGQVALRWSASVDADVTSYRLYRGSPPDFTPDLGAPLADVAGLAYVDALQGPACYRIAAVDRNGNEGATVECTPAGMTDAAPDAAPTTLALSAAWPNPARDGTSLDVRMPRAGTVTLSIHDVAGRSVRVLAAGPWPAGVRDVRWDTRDDGGRPVAAGLYFAVLETGGRRLACRVAVVR